MKVSTEILQKLKGLHSAMLDENGREMLNPLPIRMAPGLDRPPSLKEQIQRVLRHELSMQAEDQGQETFDEANDFDVEDDFELEPLSAYEVLEEEIPIMPEETIAPEDSGSTINPEAGDQTPTATEGGTPNEEGSTGDNSNAAPTGSK